jgi:hypothetical protein
VPPGQYADLDQFELPAVLVYRTLVLRTSPVESRPPSVYRLVWQGRFYDVWQRPRRPATILEHLSLGSEFDPAAVPSCTDVLRLATEAQNAGGRLATVLRPQRPTYVDLARSAHPSAWGVTGSYFVPRGSGTASVSVTVPATGSYELWMGGSFRRTLTVTVDGHEVGSVSDQLNNTGQWTPLGLARLGAGRHDVVLDYGGSPLAPGSGGFPFNTGPLELSTTNAQLPVTYVNPADARSLCGKRLDWLEVVK